MAEPDQSSAQTQSVASGGMDDFTCFQLKEYENISQAHFKTNEVLSTFYRYFILITAIPITTVGLALMNVSENGIEDETRLIAQFIFGGSSILLSIVGAAVIAYIEGLRLDAILYARVVNSIRLFFFNKPGAGAFGTPVLPTDRMKPSYRNFGSGYVIYQACALMNSVYFAIGILTFMIPRSTSLTDFQFSCSQWAVFFGCLIAAMIIQTSIRYLLISAKEAGGI